MTGVEARNGLNGGSRAHCLSGPTLHSEGFILIGAYTSERSPGNGEALEKKDRRCKMDLSFGLGQDDQVDIPHFP